MPDLVWTLVPLVVSLALSAQFLIQLSKIPPNTPAKLRTTVVALTIAAVAMLVIVALPVTRSALGDPTLPVALAMSGALFVPLFSLIVVHIVIRYRERVR